MSIWSKGFEEFSEVIDRDMRTQAGEHPVYHKEEEQI